MHDAHELEHLLEMLSITSVQWLKAIPFSYVQEAIRDERAWQLLRVIAMKREIFLAFTMRDISCSLFRTPQATAVPGAEMQSVHIGSERQVAGNMFNDIVGF
ncbi:MAG: hypothetical protein ABI876_06065 [Bacteroidota bacterium]